MLRRLLSPWLTPVHPAAASSSQDLWGRQEALSHAVDALRERVQELERAEVLRAAEHHAAVDQLTRLYKRLTVRIARENGRGTTPPPDESDDESTLALRRRLRP